MKKTFILIILFIICSKSLFAAPACPNPVTFTQPNGDTLTIVMKGDEFLKFAITEDGYTLMYDANGYFCYAQQNERGDMEPSKYIAKSINNRSAEDKLFLQSTSRGLFYSESQLEIFSQIREMSSREKSAQRAFPTTGERKLICILIGFPDKPFVRTQDEFNNLFNQVNYSFQNAKGSIKDYFLEASYNQFNLTVDVAGPYTANNNMEYYGENNPYGGNDINARELINEACILADNDINYSEYDNDKDGYVDGIYIIYAGYGEEAGGGANTIWAHQWYLDPMLLLDGVRIQNYSCSAELKGNSGYLMTNIGIICHEFGHVLGAPDYYDTSGYSGGYFEGTGTWDLQGTGCWNDDGRTPAHPNPRSKIFTYKWAVLNDLNTPQLVVVTPSTDSKTAFFRINTATSNEYFILENRQQKKFDSSVPGHGLLIYRSHSQIGTSGINATHPQQFYQVSANATVALPTQTSSSYGTISSESCPWPGTENKTQFDDTSIPSMKSWANSNTNKPISNISEDITTGNITFSFMGGTEFVINATAGLGGIISPSGTVNVPPGGDKTFNFIPNGSNVVDDVLINSVSNPDAVTAGSYTFTDVHINHTIHVTFGCPAQSLPFSETFNNTIFPPTCWENISDDYYLWKQATFGSNPACSPYSGAAMLHFDCRNYPSGASGLMVTPKISTNNQSSALSFWMFRDNTGQYTNKSDKINIYVSSNQSISGLTPVYTIYRNRLKEPVENYDGWYKYTIILDTETMNMAYVFIEGVSDNGNNIFIDELSIDEFDPNAVCYPPLNLTVSYNSNCQAELTWESPSNDINVKGYNIYRDNLKIVSDLTTTSYLDIDFDILAEHIWTVKTVCLNGESDPVSVTKPACTVLYTIEVMANPIEGGEVSGGGDYYQDKEITLTASANENYAFINWTENDVEVCTETSYKFVVERNRTLVANFIDGGGINEKELNEFTIYPNPFSDIIYLEGNISLLNKIYISNMLGQKLKEINLNEKSSFNTENLPQGVYMVTFERNDRKIVTLKIIKK